MTDQVVEEWVCPKCREPFVVTPEQAATHLHLCGVDIPLCRHCKRPLRYPTGQRRGLHTTCAAQPLDENGVCFHATCRCPGSQLTGGCCLAHREKVEL